MEVLQAVTPYANSGVDPGGPWVPGPPLTLVFEAPKLSIFGSYLIFPQFFCLALLGILFL